MTSIGKLDEARNKPVVVEAADRVGLDGVDAAGVVVDEHRGIVGDHSAENDRTGAALGHRLIETDNNIVAGLVRAPRHRRRRRFDNSILPSVRTDFDRFQKLIVGSHFLPHSSVDPLLADNSSISTVKRFESSVHLIFLRRTRAERRRHSKVCFLPKGEVIAYFSVC